jgi:hypothetical protein
MTIQLPEAGEVDRALALVYSHPELAPPAPSPWRVWLGELWDRMRAVLASLFPDLQVGSGDLYLIVWIVAALAAVVTAAVAVHLVRGGSAWWKGRERRVAPTAAGDRSGAASAGDWDVRARALADAGRWRDAVLALYQALLLRLDSRGTVRYDAAKTPGDYRRESRDDMAAAHLLDQFLRGFEPVAFGARAIDRDGYQTLQALVAQLR